MGTNRFSSILFIASCNDSKYQFFYVIGTLLTINFRIFFSIYLRLFLAWKLCLAIGCGNRKRDRKAK